MPPGIVSLHIHAPVYELFVSVLCGQMYVQNNFD